MEARYVKKVRALSITWYFSIEKYRRKLASNHKYINEHQKYIYIHTMQHSKTKTRIILDENAEHIKYNGNDIEQHL